MKKQISRREFVKGGMIAGSGLAIATVIGCGDDEEDTPDSPTLAPQATSGPATILASPVTSQPKRGGVLNRPGPVTGLFTSGLDPHVTAASDTGPMGLFYQSLIRNNPRTKVLEPEIAQQWELSSETELIFSLAPGVKWHNKPPVNGRALTADDVKFSIDRIRTNDPKFISRSLFDSVDRVEAIDKSTVKIVLRTPDAVTLRNLASLTALILAPEAVEMAGGKFETAEVAIGTGAFVLQDKDDVGATVVRNSAYWKEGLPYLESVRLHQLADDQARWSAFLAKQLDVVFVPGTEAKQVFAQQQGKDYYADWFGDFSMGGHIMPNTQRKPFNDPRVTRALRLLVDHKEALDHGQTWFGRGYLGSVIPAGLSDWDISEDEFAKFIEYKGPKDEAVKEALALLNAAGFSSSNPLSFAIVALNIPGFVQARQELLQSQYHRLSQGVVKTELSLSDLATNTALLVRGDFDFTFTGVGAPNPTDPDSWFRGLYRSNGSRNYPKFADSNLDSMIDKQRAIFDFEERKAAVKDIVRYVTEKAPFTAWGSRYILNAAQKKVKGWAPEAIQSIFGFQYESTWLDT